jgi:hypothetical protein
MSIILILLSCIVVYKFVLKINKMSNNERMPHNISPSFIQPPLVPTVIPQMMIQKDPIKEYDYKKLVDPLEEPTKRVDRYLLGPLEYRNLFNYPVRGYHDTPRWLGLLINDTDTTDNKIIKLFGRQKYPKSNQYEYYAIVNMGMDKIKIHLTNEKELNDSDPVDIHELGKTYYVKLNKNDDFGYDPHY